ncbi:MAG: N,N-dimethylformamidase beta subunit family domain-containing protein [Granulosicoccus sp.]
MDSPNNRRVPLSGYTDRLSVRPEEFIEFKLSAQTTANTHRNDLGETSVAMWLTQSICADPNPDGPGIIERPADKWFERRNVQVKQQDFQIGSYGITEPVDVLNNASSFKFEARVWPTFSSDSIQSILSYGALSLCIGSDGSLALNIGNHRVSCAEPLQLRSWVYASVSVVCGEDNIEVELQWHPCKVSDLTAQGDIQRNHLPSDCLSGVLDKPQSIVVAAQQKGTTLTHCFNGKIEAPSLTVYHSTKDPRTIAWDFSCDMSSVSVPAVHPSTHTLELKNYPARAMTGSAWMGQEMSWRHASELYGAIHFHEDDVVDFLWDTTYEWQLPTEIPSGVYVMHIDDGEHHDALPFYVCPPKGKPSHKLCVLIPTFTYAIYGNHARPDWEPSWQDQAASRDAYPYNPAQYPDYGQSTYNYHKDGSGICHASHRRPLFNLRPGYITFGNASCSGLRHFQADSHLLSWLDAHNIGFDVITDRELHDEGVAAIAQYEHVMTTTHPEYHTSESLDALTHYRDNGGHLSYLGGNGFYWRIALHPEQQATLEIRRAEDGIRAWAAEPGEYYHAFDGHYGGLWRRNGRPPQALCGLGFSAQGQFNGSYYRKRPVAHELAWVFEGIDDDLIGDFGLSGSGAAGFELDRADTHLGTPKNATVLARSENHGSDFILVPEEMLTHLTTLPGPQAQELLHADILWFELPGGGSVFAVGSITFCGSLPHNKFDNNISRLLLNVVKHVADRHD